MYKKVAFRKASPGQPLIPRNNNVIFFSCHWSDCALNNDWQLTFNWRCACKSYMLHLINLIELSIYLEWTNNHVKINTCIMQLCISSFYKAGLICRSVPHWFSDVIGIWVSQYWHCKNNFLCAHLIGKSISFPV